jgi:ankyrin repeat protein
MKALRALAALASALVLSAAHAGSYDDFFRALVGDDASTVVSLLRRGFDPNTVDEKGELALNRALRLESFKVAEALLASPALQVDAVNGANETPLMLAAIQGNVDWTRKLLARGAALQRPGWSPVLYAASAPNAQVLALLLDRGAPLEARAPNGSTPLMMASGYGSEESVKLLLAHGADVQVRNAQELSAADFARRAGRESLARRLDALMAPAR